MTRMFNGDEALETATGAWRRHYLVEDCPICRIGNTAAEDRFCELGEALRIAAIAHGEAARRRVRGVPLGEFP